MSEMIRVVVAEREKTRLGLFLKDEEGSMSPTRFGDHDSIRTRLTDEVISAALEIGAVFSSLVISPDDYIAVLRRTYAQGTDARAHSRKLLDFGEWVLAPFDADDETWARKVSIRIAALN
jgi:hypothetical protein